MFWYVAFFVVAFVASYVFAPRPPNSNQPQMKPNKNLQAPTAESGREIGVLFGTREIKGSNCVWYGNLRTTPIQRSSGGGGGKK